MSDGAVFRIDLSILMMESPPAGLGFAGVGLFWSMYCCTQRLFSLSNVRPARITFDCVIGIWYSVKVPSDVTRVTRLPDSSVNHIAFGVPGSGTMAMGRLLRVGMAFSRMSPFGVMRQIALPTSSVTHIVPSLPART